METFNIHVAKTHLSKLIDKVEHGEEVIISRAGKPVAKLIPCGDVKPSKKPREFGQLKGKIGYSPEDDRAADAEIQKMFDDSINEDWEKLYGIPDPSKKPRQFGQWTGKVKYAPDYDQADAIIQKMFEESEIIPKD